MPLGTGASGIKDAMKGFLNKSNVGGAQLGTPNVPLAPGAPGGGISVPASQLGPVAVGDTITLTVTAVEGDNVSLEKVEAAPAAPVAAPAGGALPPIQ